MNVETEPRLHGLSTCRQRDINKITERGEQVTQIDIFLYDARCKVVRPTDNQRHAHRCCEEMTLFPHTMFSKHLAVVGGIDDDPSIQILANLL